MSLAMNDQAHTAMREVLHPAALVVEATQGVFRTVAALRGRHEWFIALAPDHPLYAALAGLAQVTVMEADGMAFAARPVVETDGALVSRVRSALQERLANLRAAAATDHAPRIFRLVLDRVMASERGNSPRT